MQWFIQRLHCPLLDTATRHLHKRGHCGSHLYYLQKPNQGQQVCVLTAPSQLCVQLQLALNFHLVKGCEDLEK